MAHFIEPSFAKLLQAHHLNTFEALWQLPGEQVEEGNIKARSGHSHVCRVVLDDCMAYIKKQSNYATSASRFSRQPRAICRREFENIQAWHAEGLPTMDALYFDEVQQPLRGMLATKALTGFVPLDEAVLNLTSEMRLDVLKRAGTLLRIIHEHGWLHRCFFPKHVFVKIEHGQPVLKMIDLEKARKTWVTPRGRAHDLASFDRRMQWLSTAEREAFFNAYFASSKRDCCKWLIQYLAQRRVGRKRNYSPEKSP